MATGDLLVLPAAKSAKSFFRGQLIHLGSIPVLALVAWVFAAPSVDDGIWLGLSETEWFGLCLLVPIVHQVYVWLGWRAQLGWQLYTRVFGAADFKVWGVTFMIPFLARPLVVIGVGVADTGSAELWPQTAWGIGGLLLLPAIYTLFSVGKYFGLNRALGGDHFRESYRHMPFVKRGAFRWTPNAMYTIAFLMFWGIGLIANSRLALAAAFFQHAYIWAHFLGTESPDMALIYGSNGEEGGAD